MLVWSRPPCVTNSSSNTSRIGVSHTLELTYIIYITRVSNGTTFNITVSTIYTYYDLSSMMKPCSVYHLEVCAHSTEHVGERSTPAVKYTMPGIHYIIQCLYIIVDHSKFIHFDHRLSNVSDRTSFRIINRTICCHDICWSW